MDTHDLYSPVFYQSYNIDKITNYKIIGERHSGTNWLENILNSRLSLNLTWNCGPKHFINPSPNELAKSDNILFICIIRNIYDWIGGFFRLPHHVDDSLLTDFNKFLLSEWKSEIEDNHYLTNKPYKNIFDLRKSKLEHIYLYLPYIVSNMVVTRYEDLCTDPETLITFISKTFNIQKTQYRYYSGTKPRIKAPYIFQPDILEIINTNTDWKVEQYFNYMIKMNDHESLNNEA